MKTLRRSTLSIATLLLLSACGGQIDSVSTQKKSMQAAPELAIAAAPADASFPEPRANYTIAHSEVGVTVTHITSKVATVVKSATRLQFSDMSMNLLVAQNAKTIAEKDLNSLIDLYIAFFNRAPDADGLNYWINSIKSGTSLDQIAASFYQAALAYPVQTGYSANMSNEDFVRIIYKNVLGRTGTTAPNDSEVKYWADDIRNGSPKSKLINTMLVSARTFASDKEWGWVTTLLNNKVAVGKYFAIEQGLNYNTPEDSITNTMKMVALITPTDVAAAKKTLALSETALNLSLSSGSGQGRMLDCFNPDLYAVGTHIVEERLETKDGVARGSLVLDTRVSGSVDFKGNTALLISGTATSVSSGSTFTTPVNWYVAVGKQEFSDLGEISERQLGSDQATTKVISFHTPALRIPFNLTIGQSLTQTYSTIVEEVVTHAQVSQAMTTETLSFLGVEEITVPAGSFSACKLKEVTVQKPPYADQITYVWHIAAGPYRGLIARVFDDGRWLFEASKLTLTKQ